MCTPIGHRPGETTILAHIYDQFLRKFCGRKLCHQIGQCFQKMYNNPISDDFVSVASWIRQVFSEYDIRLSSQDILRPFWNLKIHNRVCKFPHSVTGSHTEPDESVPNYQLHNFFLIHFVISVPSTFDSYDQALSWFPINMFLHHLSLPFVMQVTQIILLHLFMLKFIKELRGLSP